MSDIMISEILHRSAEVKNKMISVCAGPAKQPAQMIAASMRKGGKLMLCGNREVNGKFVNGKPSALEATYTWKTEDDFERFMRFAQRYAAANGLGYSQNQNQDQTGETSEADG